MATPDLTTLGWNAHWQDAFAASAAEGLVPARVSLEHQHIYTVCTGEAEILATVAGRFRHRAAGKHEFPAVGDWVALKPRTDARARATIHAVLPRTSRFSRKAAGDVTEEQVVAANIDVVFLVSGLDHDFNPRRIERYLVTAWDGGATPVIILNKADLCDDVAGSIAEVEAIAAGTPIHAISSSERAGLDALQPYLAVGRTVALLGSSGVGKSTLINALLGVERQRTFVVRESDSHGRHTTTNRELIVLPQGGLLIDTPGMRELQLWEGTGLMSGAFDDIAAVAASCHYRDCKHDTEPICAVKDAVARGEIPEDRLESYRRLQREARHLEAKVDERAALEEKRKWKVIHKNMKRFTSKRI
jgi:ribosome biogenesis GTPase